MRLKISILALTVLLSHTIPAAAQIDTDGDGLLDLIDVPGFNPTAEGSASFIRRGVQDLDGTSQLTNLQTLELDYNQITSLEQGDFDGLSNLQTLDLRSNRITSLEQG